MEKSTPHCKLPIIKTLLAAGQVRTTHSARAGANGMGFDFAGMLAVIAQLTPTDFSRA